MKLRSLILTAILFVLTNESFAQFPGCPDIDAGLDQTLPCGTNCTNLTAVPFHAGATNTYTVGNIPHAPPISYTQAGGTVVSAATDDIWSPIINLPFPFCFYGQTYTTCKVGSNGAIDLGPPTGGGYHPWSFTANCPSTALTGAGNIFGVYQDIYPPAGGGTMKWYLLGSAPCRIFVVVYNNISQYSCTNLKVSTMMVLYETTNVIDVYVKQKQTCTTWNGGRGIIGIQNEAGTVGLAAPGRNSTPGPWTVNTANSEAWRFTPNGPPIYSVNWYDGATLLGSGNTINVCPAGTTTTYTAEVTYTRCDGVQIVENDQVTINYANLNAPVVTPVDEACAGANDGSVTINNAPGSGPYTVSITGPSNQSFVEPNTAGGVANFTGLPDGLYNYTVTDAGGCTYTGTFTINPGPTCCSVTAVGTDLVCNADNSGTVTANPVGTAPFSYSWTNGGGVNQTGTGLAAGNYVVTMTDNIGCIATANVTINEPAALTATNTPTPVSCFGLCDGQIAITAPSGGTAPYQYNINAGAFAGASTFNGLCQGNYNVIMQDAVGCQFVMPGIAITEPTDLTLVQASTTPATCGASNGALSVTAGGGTPGYQYNIGGANQASSTFNGLAAGAYNVTVTDLNGCTEVVVVNVANSAGPVPFVDSQAGVTCAGGLNGSVTIGVNGGTGPYLFSLDGGANQAGNSFAVSAGAHTVLVTDANGCSGSIPFNIAQPTALTYATAVTSATCNGVCDGTVTVTAAGATPPYQYSSNNGLTFQASNVLTGLCAGNINVVVQDANGCLANSVEPIAQPAALTSGSSFVEPSCHGLSDGTISFTPAGGTPGYTFSVDNGATFTAPNPQTGIAAGTYDIAVQDANGCQFTDQIIVTEPPAFNFLFIANNPSNCGASDGSFEIIATNGQAPYTYSIDGGVTSQFNNGFFMNLFSGLYQLVTTDANGCSDSVFSALSDNIMTTAIDVIVPTTCKGSCDGLAIISQQFGAPPFTYTINTGGTQGGGVFGNLCAGQHFVTVQDAGLCLGIQEVIILEPDSVEYTPTLTHVTCPGGTDGIIDFGAVTGGTGGPYTYSIDGGTTFQAGAVFNGLPIGPYDCVAMDANGCIGTVTVTLTEPPAWNVVVNANDLTCFQNNTGFIQIVGGGSTAPYTYDLSGTPSATGIYAGIAAANYNITVTDVNLCTFTTTQLINEPTQVTEVNVLTHVSCNATCDGIIDVTAGGGTPPYSYSSNGGVINQSSNLLTGLCAGNYDLYVEDANGCNITTNLDITEPTPLGMGVVTNPATCGLPNGDLTVTGNNGTPGYTYSNDGGASFQAATLFAGLAPGNYDVVIQDLNGCQYTETHSIVSQNSPQIITVTLTDVDCNGNCNGEIDVQANGGTGALTFDIGGAGQPAGLFQNVCAANYTVTVTDANGCIATQPANIIEPAVLDHVTIDTDLLCFQDNSGGIDVNASGGTLPYAYSFNGGASFGNSDVANFLPAGSVDVVTQDANGCQFTTNVVLDEPTQLIVDAQNQTDVTCFDLADGTADVTVIGGTPGYAYAWSGGVAAGNAVSGLTAGGYSVDVTDANGCLVQAVFNLTQPPMVVITSVSAVDVSCAGGADGQINVNSAQAVQYSAVLAGNAPVFQAGNTFTGLAAGTYDVTVENANGCPQTTQIVINEPAPLALGAVPPIQVCFDGQGTLLAPDVTGGTAPYYYVWNGTDTTQYLPVQNVTDMTGPTPFTCIVFDANGCTSNAQVGNVTVPFAQFYLDPLNPDTVDVCPGVPVTMTGVGNLGWNNGPYYYQWLTPAMDTLDSGSNPFTYTPSGVGSETILLVGRDDCNAFDTTEMVINVLDNPTPSFTVGSPSGCSPLNSTFVNTTPGNFNSDLCVWTFSNGDTYIGCSGANATFLSPGCYDVTLAVTTDEGCGGTTTVSSAICVSPDPTPGFYWEPSQPSLVDPTVNIVDISQNATSFAYSFNSQGSSSEQNPTFTFTGLTGETVVTVCQQVTSPEGCTADTCQQITIYEDILFYIPNIFTPDGDLFNETFSPVFTSGIDIYDFHFTIFNRWGEILFESYNTEKGWNGEYGGGGLVKDGTYIWQLEFGEKISDAKQKHRGHVTVLK